MPRNRPSRHVLDIRGSVYSSLVSRMATLEGEIYPLHVGDTWMEPAEGCRMEDLSIDQYPGMHRYAPTTGYPPLVDALVERTRRRTGLEIERRNIQVTAGATVGLGCAVGAFLEPGDEVLVLAPYWPLIEGIVRTMRGTPVAVPIDELDDIDAILAALDQRLDARTVALYFGFPNNPTGRTVPEAWIEALVDWAARNDLWIVSDEVYDEYAYRGQSANVLPLAPERTFTAHSFSKTYGMAGNRCGFIVGPSPMMPEVEKISTHTAYSATTASQICALRVLEGGSAWVERARKLYSEIGDRTAARLNVDPPDGGTFLFLDVESHLDDRGLLGLLEDCADHGVFLAPGPSFGPYPSHARLCFTAVEPEITARGVEVLAEILTRKSSKKPGHT